MLSSLQKYTTLILFFLSFSFNSKGQLNWRGDTPVYPATNQSHTYTGVSGLTPSRNATVSTSIGSSGVYSSGYPFVPTGGNSRLSIGVNFDINNTSTSTATTTIGFSHPACDAIFNIDDIDLSGGSEPYDYVDVVTITAVNTAATTINPSSISSAGINTISGGNTITGTSSGSGTNTVSFSGSCINSITFSFRTGANAKTNPNAQQYAIEDINSKESAGDPFPVSYSKFEATQNHKSLELKWVTEKETNNEGFAVQRSSDAKSFETIGIVKGQNEKSDYSFLDTRPFEGYNYYRLEQKDFDGSKTLSKIIAVLFLPDGEVKVFPNPAVAGDNITISGLTSEGNFEVFKLNGQKVPTASQKDQLRLNSGEYFIKVFHPYGYESKRLIVR
ncbi:Por secretion system C-terminal sorting domain-containing protein [Spirosomataceae bacterium TFI 002]|nr:Por secretion system C-terminal sorting domain-containing protein [Spirosomataceae bacterium TFI 002]